MLLELLTLPLCTRTKTNMDPWKPCKGRNIGDKKNQCCNGWAFKGQSLVENIVKKNRPDLQPPNECNFFFLHLLLCRTPCRFFVHSIWLMSLPSIISVLRSIMWVVLCVYWGCLCWVLVEIFMVIVVGYVACKIISSQWGLCSGDVVVWCGRFVTWLLCVRVYMWSGACDVVVSSWCVLTGLRHGFLCV
jgi:hypothetical protein